MSPTIRIDEEVFDELKKHAEPFVDTPNSVLRRILGLGQAAEQDEGHLKAEAASPRSPGSAAAKSAVNPRSRRRRAKAARPPRAKAGSILHESAYEIPMLEIINAHGGRAPAREVLEELGKCLADQLTETDHQELASGDVRWRNRAQFVRLRLIDRGDMVKNSPRGVWEISQQGRQRVADAA